MKQSNDEELYCVAHSIRQTVKPATKPDESRNLHLVPARLPLHVSIANEVVLLELEDGVFKATRGGLYAMQSDYFDALLATPLTVSSKLEDVHMADFKEMYELKEWVSMIVGHDLAWIEDWCNKLVLADRFQMKKIVELYAKRLIEPKVSSLLPASVVEILLNRSYRPNLSVNELVKLICEEGLEPSLVVKYYSNDMYLLSALVRDHKDCTPFIFSHFVEGVVYAPKIYTYVQRRLISERAGLKWMMKFGASWNFRVTNASPASKEPLEFDLLIRCGAAMFDQQTGQPMLVYRYDHPMIPRHFEIHDADDQVICTCDEAELKNITLEKYPGAIIYAVI